MNAFTVEVTKEALAIATLFSAEEDVRHYLKGVCVQRTETDARLVATNGHALMVCKLVETDDTTAEGTGEAILTPESVAHILATFKAQGRSPSPLPLRFEPKDDSYTVAIFDGKDWLASGLTVVGNFPDYRRVVPAETSGETKSQYDPTYIGAFSKAARLAGRRAGMVNVAYNGESGAPVSIGDDDRYIGVLMPMRGDDPKRSRPEWVGK